MQDHDLLYCLTYFNYRDDDFVKDQNNFVVSADNSSNKTSSFHSNESRELNAWLRYNPFADAPEEDDNRIPQNSLERGLKKVERNHNPVLMRNVASCSEFLASGLDNIMRNEQRADFDFVDDFKNIYFSHDGSSMLKYFELSPIIFN